MRGPDFGMQNEYKKNIEATYENPASRIEFIQNWAKRTGISFEVAWHQFCTSDMGVAFFAKDPRRQNKHEQIAADWIKKLPLVKSFKKLPPNGPDALYLIGGKVVPHDQLANFDSPKSIDFHWSIELPGHSKARLEFYASHKYTDEDGGSQDNQYSDIKAFTEEAAKLQKEKYVRLISLADGKYYQKKRSSNDNLSYMENLKKIVSNTQYAEAMQCIELPIYFIKTIDAIYKSHNIQVTAHLQQELEGLNLI